MHGSHNRIIYFNSSHACDSCILLKQGGRSDETDIIPQTGGNDLIGS